MQLRALSIFCEDVREEKSGQETIIGALSDTIYVSSGPNVLPFLKFAIFNKVYFPIEFEPVAFKIRAVDDEGIEVASSEITKELMQMSRAGGEGKPLYGVKTTLSFAMLTQIAPAYIHAQIVIGDDITTTGMLYLNRVEAPDASEDESANQPG